MIARLQFLHGEHGYHGTTFEQVAQRTGVTRTADTYHFPSKRALYQQVTEASYRAVLAPAVREAVKERTLAQQPPALRSVPSSGARAVRRHRLRQRVHAAIAVRADFEHAAVMRGDEWRGTFGRYEPAPWWRA